MEKTMFLIGLLMLIMSNRNSVSSLTQGANDIESSKDLPSHVVFIIEIRQRKTEQLNQTRYVQLKNCFEKTLIAIYDA